MAAAARGRGYVYPALLSVLADVNPGGWFWWGAQGPAPCKALYNLIYDRLTNYHKLNNLVWIWNSVAADWYPGDSTVDVLAYDSYPSTPGDHGVSISPLPLPPAPTDG